MEDADFRELCGSASPHPVRCHVIGIIRPKTMFNLKSNLCWLVFNVWWGETSCLGASFCRFAVSLFSNVHFVKKSFHQHTFSCPRRNCKQ